MKNFKFYYAFVLVAFGLFITSCGEEDEHGDNEITITIKEPLNGAVISDCSTVQIHVDVEASEENHEVEVVLHPDGDVDDKIIDYDAHDHDKIITFDQAVDLCSYAAGTCFHLEVQACVDHDCEEIATAEAEFCLQ